MENEFDLEDREKFKINPETWLHTLLAIAGDKEKKAEIVKRVAQTTGLAPEKIEMIIAATIRVLINQTRAN